MVEHVGRDEAFVRHLQALNEHDDRGALAALRRGLGKPPGTVAETYPHVIPWTQGLGSRHEEDNYFLIAALFASHPAPGGSGGIGEVLRRIGQAMDSASIEHRFVAMLNCHRDELPDHLRHTVALARSKDVPIDWLQLLRDIKWWGHQERRVQRRWAQEFWRFVESTQAEQQPEEQIQSE